MDWSTHGLDNSRTSQLTDWTSRGLADAAKRTKTKHAKSPVAFASCPVRELSSPRVDQSARCPVRKLSSPWVGNLQVGVPASCPVTADSDAQAVGPQVTVSHPPGGRLPLLSARPVVTFPATEHHRPLAGTKLYCLVTEAHRCEQLAQDCYAELPGVGFEPTIYWSQVQCSTHWLGYRKDIRPIKNLCHWSQKVIFGNKWQREPKGNWLIQVYLVNSC